MATILKPKVSSTSLSVPATGDLEVGELAMNLADGKFYSKTSGGTIKEMGGGGAVSLNDTTANGNITDQDIILNGSDLVFEGNLPNAFETFLTVAEPTADRTITLPDQSGVVAMDGDALAYSIVFGG